MNVQQLEKNLSKVLKEERIMGTEETAMETERLKIHTQVNQTDVTGRTHENQGREGREGGLD